VLIRARGGKERGGAKLTPFAVRFLAEYERLQNRVKKYAESKFTLFCRAVRSRRPSGKTKNERTLKKRDGGG